jgi:hypothetical protein
MSWKEYYQTVPESFCNQFGYDILKRIFSDEEKFPLSSKKTLNLVLGGLSPYTKTTRSFIGYCQNLRPEQEDNFFLVDANRQPLREIYLGSEFQGNINLVQADLTSLPFDNKSVDLIFLDGTAMFMDDNRVGRFAKEANRTLTKNGLIVSFSSEPLSKYTIPLENLKDRLINHVPIYHRPKNKQRLLLNPLKVVSCFDCEGYLAIVAGKKDNPLPEFSGQPYALE